MSNELVKSEQIPFGELMSIAKAFSESGMFADIKSAAQAVVKIQAGQELGIAPFAAMSGIHIIKGKPTVGANLMAAKVKASGKYDYKVIQQTDKACSIDFYQGNVKIGNSTFTIDDAKKAGTQNIDKFPRNMLFARAISNGVRWYTPDIFTSPVYTPEELKEITEDVPHVDVTPTPPASEPVKVALTEKALQQAVDRIKGGELALVDKLIENYDLTEDQLKRINEAIPTEAETA